MDKLRSGESIRVERPRVPPRRGRVKRRVVQSILKMVGVPGKYRLLKDQGSSGGVGSSWLNPDIRSEKLEPESVAMVGRRVEDEPARLNQDMTELEAESVNDVLLSFSAYDNLSVFAGFLCRCLVLAGIPVSSDDGTLSTLPDGLLLSVHSSKIYVPIFSRNYAGSPRCLDALALMVEHTSRSGGKKEILPVLYDVQRSDVQLEKKSLYSDALDTHRRRLGDEKVEQWKKALVEVGKVKGWELSSYESEVVLVKSIVREILLKVKIEHNYVLQDLYTGADSMLSYRTSASRWWSLLRSVVTFLCFLFRLQKIRNQAHSKHMFQRMALSSGSYSTSELEDSQVLQIISLLDMELNGTRIVGIHGRDGIGKTALAKIIYNKISVHFDACSFLAEIEETIKQPGGVQCLQTKLIFDILKREYEVASAFKEIRFLKEISRNMKVLLVFDDVENEALLEEFVGAKLDWFGSGSRIIVTSKQRSILQEYVDQGLALTYDVSLMDDDRAFDLFWQYARGRNCEQHPYVEIAKKLVKAAEGLPLLVKVFGSFLHGKGQKEWIKFKDIIKQFRGDYWKILTIIYEALDHKQKQMYLDIACFLPCVDCRIASYMWHDYYHPHDELEVLCRMSLIKVEENKISMHSMLRCLAKKIIYEGLHDPRTFVRSYIPATAQYKKKSIMGTDQRNTEMAGFEIHPNTIFLSLGCADNGGKFADALLNIRWLHWQGCPQDIKAISIHLVNLFILDLSWSKLTESWGCSKGIKMEHLKVLNLTGCVDLLVTPSFSCCPNLEILILERCSRLVHLDPSINYLKLLVTLNLKFCSELSMLPVEMDGMNALEELLIDATSIRELPASIGKLVQLQILSATNCFSLVRVPGSVCELKAVSVLALDDAIILELPESLGDLRELRRLSLRDCHGLRKLPESIGKLKDSLLDLDISGTGISKLPVSIKNLRSLKVLKMDSCFLREFPRDIGELTDLEEIHASWCRSLEGVIPSDISKLRRLRELMLRGTCISNLPPEIQFMSSLKTLDLLHCDDLKELPTLPSSLINLYVDPNLKQKL